MAATDVNAMAKTDKTQLAKTRKLRPVPAQMLHPHRLLPLTPRVKIVQHNAPTLSVHNKPLPQARQLQ
jgi:hypothetical protein